MAAIPDVTDDFVDSDEIEELLDHAEAAFTASVLSTIAFCKERGIPFAEWVAFTSARVAPTWEDAQGLGARDVAKLAALGIVAGGGDIHGLSGDDARAELAFTCPDTEDLELFGLTRADVDPFLNLYAPIATHLGLSYSASRDGDVASAVWSR